MDITMEIYDSIIEALEVVLTDMNMVAWDTSIEYAGCEQWNAKVHLEDDTWMDVLFTSDATVVMKNTPYKR